MSDASSNAGPPPPDVAPEGIKEIAPGVFVIPDNRVPLVPNIGIIVGADAALVVDTGMGPANGRKVLAAAKRVAGKPTAHSDSHALSPGARLWSAGIQGRRAHPL